MFKRIDHVAIHVADLDRSVQFYERHFGFRHYFQHAASGGLQIAYLKLADTVLELTHHSDGSMAGLREHALNGANDAAAAFAHPCHT